MTIEDRQQEPDAATPSRRGLATGCARWTPLSLAAALPRAVGQGSGPGSPAPLPRGADSANAALLTPPTAAPDGGEETPPGSP